MADARIQNPIAAALIDDLAGRIHDLDAVQRHIDLVRAQIAENDALYAEAAAQLAEAGQRLVGAVFDAAARRARAPRESEELELVLLLGDPEVAARAAAYSEVVARIKRFQQAEQLLVDALGILVVARAFSVACARARFLPGVLLTVAAAYALAFAASWGAVVPGPASLLRISFLLLCFLFGVPVVGDLAQA